MRHMPACLPWAWLHCVVGASYANTCRRLLIWRARLRDRRAFNLEGGPPWPPRVCEYLARLRRSATLQMRREPRVIRMTMGPGALAVRSGRRLLIWRAGLRDRRVCVESRVPAGAIAAARLRRSATLQ